MRNETTDETMTTFHQQLRALNAEWSLEQLRFVYTNGRILVLDKQQHPGSRGIGWADSIGDAHVMAARYCDPSRPACFPTTR
jgi:hypothetical protein